MVKPAASLKHSSETVHYVLNLKWSWDAHQSHWIKQLPCQILTEVMNNSDHQ